MASDLPPSTLAYVDQFAASLRGEANRPDLRDAAELVRDVLEQVAQGIEQALLPDATLTRTQVVQIIRETGNAYGVLAEQLGAES